MKKLTDLVVYFLVRVFVCVIQALSIETCHRISKMLALVANDLIGLRRRVIDENLTSVYPSMDRGARRKLSRRMWEHLLLMVCEIAHVRRKIHDSNFHQYVTFRGKPEFLQYLLDKRPTVLVMGHFGNFEVAGYIAGLFGFPTHTVARPMDNPYIDRFINQFRESTGQYILPRDGSREPISRVLASGGTLALLGDQHAGEKGCWVPFMGRLASCHKAVALFTLTSGAPQIVAYLRRTDKPLHFELGIEAIADPQTMDSELEGVRPLTEWYNHHLEQIVRRSPEQYWWLHRRWKQPPARLRRAA